MEPETHHTQNAATAEQVERKRAGRPTGTLAVRFAQARGEVVYDPKVRKGVKSMAKGVTETIGITSHEGRAKKMAVRFGARLLIKSVLKSAAPPVMLAEGMVRVTPGYLTASKAALAASWRGFTRSPGEVQGPIPFFVRPPTAQAEALNASATVPGRVEYNFGAPAQEAGQIPNANNTVQAQVRPLAIAEPARRQ